MLDKIDYRDLSYIIGFLQGDGHHSESTRNRGRITIELNSKDIDILNKIQELLSPYINVTITGRIRDTNFKKYSQQSTLSIYDWGFRTDIKPYVPVGCKSDIIEPPLQLSSFSKRDYIRGLIDADGSIGISKANRPFISLCVSSESIKEFLIKDIEEVTGLKKYMQRNARDNVYNIMLNNEEAIQYADYLYKDSNLYLDRKYNEYLNFNNWIRDANTKKRDFIVKKWTEEEDKIVLNKEFSIEEKIDLLKRTKRSVKMRQLRLNNNFKY